MSRKKRISPVFFNKLAESLNMRPGGIIAILGDVEVAENTAFSSGSALKGPQEPPPETCPGDSGG